MMQEFVQEIQNTVQRGLRGIHTAMPGRIVSFDAAKGIATVKPAMKFKKPDGKTMDFPQVTGVPVVFPQGAGQGATIAFPVKPGDSCLLVVAEQSLDYWQYGQETSTDLAFDMTNAICIPGLFAQREPRGRGCLRPKCGHRRCQGNPPDSQGRLRDDFCSRSHRRGKPDCDRQPVVLGP